MVYYDDNPWVAELQDKLDAERARSRRFERHLIEKDEVIESLRDHIDKLTEDLDANEQDLNSLEFQVKMLDQTLSQRDARIRTLESMVDATKFYPPQPNPYYIGDYPPPQPPVHYFTTTTNKITYDDLVKGKEGSSGD